MTHSHLVLATSPAQLTLVSLSLTKEEAHWDQVKGIGRMLDGHEALNGHELICDGHTVGGGCQGTHLDDFMTRLRLLWRMCYTILYEMFVSPITSVMVRLLLPSMRKLTYRTISSLMTQGHCHFCLCCSSHP